MVRYSWLKLKSEIPVENNRDYWIKPQIWYETQPKPEPILIPRVKLVRATDLDPEFIDLMSKAMEAMAPIWKREQDRSMNLFFDNTISLENICQPMSGPSPLIFNMKSRYYHMTEKKDDEQQTGQP